MRNRPKISTNLILGVLVGFGAVAILLNLNNLVISILANKNSNVRYDLINYGMILLSVLAFGFIVRSFKRMKSKKLAFYIILSMVAAAGGAVFTWYMFFYVASFIFEKRVLHDFLASDNGMLIVISSTYLIFLLVLTIFVLIFMILVNRKIKYISYISNEVKRIEEEGFGLQIQEKGNDELTELSAGINYMSSKLKEKIEYEKKSRWKKMN